MPLRETAPVGAPCWVDLLTSDPDESRTFYGELFGWTAEEPNPQFGGYWNFLKDGVHIAGGMHNDGSSGQPDRVVGVSGDRRRAGHARRGGGERRSGRRARDGGRRPRHDGDVIDPGGAAIGMWQPGLHKGFGIVGETGAPSWFELHTREYDAVRRVLPRRCSNGTRTCTRDSPEFRYTVLGDGENQEAGIMDAAALPPGRYAERLVDLLRRGRHRRRAGPRRRARRSGRPARARTRRTDASPRRSIRRARRSS